MLKFFITLNWTIKKYSSLKKQVLIQPRQWKNQKRMALGSGGLKKKMSFAKYYCGGEGLRLRPHWDSHVSFSCSARGQLHSYIVT